MPDLDKVVITSIPVEPVKVIKIDLRSNGNRWPLPEESEAEHDELSGNEVDEVKAVLDKVIDFLEDLRFSGELLKKGGQLLRDVEELRGKL